MNIYKHSITYYLLIIFITISCNVLQLPKKPLKIDALRESFQKPPASVQTAVYWYWISDNISKEGIVNDLHAMKKAGINRAFIGNIGLDNVPYGDVKMLSDEWWECIHLALKTATELDIEIGVFNSPGWSQSGGPWVKAENSMRYLTSSVTNIKGPITVHEKLKKPEEVFQDLKVLAFPTPEERKNIFEPKLRSISSKPSTDNLELLLDGKTEKAVFFPKNQEFIIDIEYDEIFTARSLTLNYPKSPIYAEVQLQVLDNDGNFKTHHSFEIDRTKFTIDVGFKVLAPLQISFKEVKSTKFRLKFNYLFHKDWPNPGVNRNPGLTEIKLSSAVVLGNYAEKSLAKMHPTPLPNSSDYQWGIQSEPIDLSMITNPKEILDLTDYLESDGTLHWKAPEGDWTVLRFGMTPTGVKNSPASPEATGYEVDKMSKAHVKKHFYGHIGEILKRVPPQDRKTFKVVVQDSYEKGGQNITDGFLEEFKEIYGYDPIPFLPTFEGFVIKSQLDSDRFLWDVRRLVANKVAYDYVGGLKEISNKHGLSTWLENYGHWGFPSEFLMYGGQSDEISGEFWSEGTLGDIENRAAVSSGHIYGKQKIWAESFTSGRQPFSRTPAMLKPRGDRFFAEGINSTLLHVYIHQPYEDKNPGLNAWFGNPFNRKNTWFSQLDIFTDYIKRTNLMLQQGQNIADVAYFIGEDTPIMTGTTNPSLPVGYEFDYINAEVIINAMTVKDGLLTLPHGTQYRILVIPEQNTMRPELLLKIKQLVENGATILGAPPVQSPSGQNQPHADIIVKKLAAEIWGNVDGVNIKSRRLGKGLVLNMKTMEEALGEIKLIPDCKLPADNSIHYGHRKLENENVYFLSNQTADEQIISPEFRVTGKKPELWLATTGEMRTLPAYKTSSVSTTIPLKLAPYESVFVVFSDEASQSEKEDLEFNFPLPNESIDISSNWTVHFDPTMRGPKQAVKFDSLIDWTTSNNDRIKFYSGKALYSKNIQIDKALVGKSFRLDLGNLSAIARIYLNGKDVGGLWTPPFQIDISDNIVPGINKLEIEVINNWKNRLIGDANLPEYERPTWCTYNTYTKDSELQSSGLLGPVTISIF